ncbi:PIN domain-containing protein [Aquabacterium sp.]|uniref:PIN domain-containing protein n=1 Tax=Aquabacterium sp. TaxID=1872578 RepID=UPI002BF7AAC0|nr:PIN domain-containing protein [Aquabacterium sp.]HSW05966.1 PIN domain-containing protein [Aquabacterium sp.]
MSTFFDTNVLVYAFDRGAGQRHAVADAVLAQHLIARTLVISTQVLLETYSVLTRKKGVRPDVALTGLSALAQEKVVPASADFVLRSMATSQRHQLSIWDALILQAALDAGCDALLSEDLQAGQRFGTLEVVNPFAPGAHDVPPAAYGSQPAPSNTARKRAAAKPSPPGKR